MGLNIIYGRAGCGKTSHAIRAIKKLVESKTGKPILLIVPEQFSYQTEKLLITAIGATGASVAEVVTLRRLAGRIFSDTYGASKKMLSAAGKNMLVYRALYRRRSQLGMYARAALQLGFTDKMSELLSEMKRYGVSAQRVSELAKSVKDVALGQKLSDVSLIYAEYERLLMRDYIDADDNMYQAAGILASSSYLDGAYIFVDEFADFLPQYYAMLEALLIKCTQMNVYLTSDEAFDTEGFFAPAARTRQRLFQLCRQNNLPEPKCVYLKMHNSQNRSEALAYLEKGYTDYQAAAYDKPTDEITIFEATNVGSELSGCARRILSLCRDAGYRMGEIAVCLGDMERYGQPAASVLERHGISAFLSQRVAASRHPLTQTILSAIDIFLKGWRSEAVFSYLKTGFSNLSCDEVDELENYVLAAHIPAKAWTDQKVWQFKTSFLSEVDTPAFFERIDAIRKKAVAPLMRLRAGIGSQHTVTHACRSIYAFMEELGLFERTQQMVCELKAAGELQQANGYSRIYNTILDILDQCVLIAGTEKLGIKQLRGILAAGFLKEDSGFVPQSTDEVILCDLSGARAQQARVTFFVGTNSGQFLSSAGKQGLLSDADRMLLEQAGTQLAPQTRQKAFDDRFAVYKALTKPTDRIFLSYAFADMEGAALPASPVCERLRRLFPELTVVDDLGSDQADEREAVCAPVVTFQEMARRAGQRRRGESANSLWRAVFRWYEHSPRYRAQTERLLQLCRYDTAASPLAADLTEKLYGQGLTTSVSRLEQYRRCPFSYFISYTLNAKERKRLHIDAPDIGSIMHMVLDRFFTQLEAQGLSYRSLTREQCGAIISTIVDSLSVKLFANCTLGAKAGQYQIARVKENLIRCVLLFTEHLRRSSFEPAGTEVTFGADGALGAVVINLMNGKKMKIRGKIDRLDTLKTPQGTFLRVIDYKSGSKEFRLDNLYHKLDLQLAVYLDAALQNKHTKPAGMLYFRLSEPLSRAQCALSEQEAESQLKKALRPDGLLLKDVDILRSMDASLLQASEFLPVSIKKDGELSESSSVATMQQFSLLSRHVKRGLRELGNAMISGSIAIRPCRQADVSACTYCQYKSICQFNEKKRAFSYDDCEKMRTGDVWAAIEREQGGEQLGRELDTGAETGD